MKFFHGLRTAIEKQARLTTLTGGRLHYQTDDRGMPVGVGEAPPGALGFILGDETGGSSWIVPGADGEHYLQPFQLDPAIGATYLQLPEAPTIDGVSGHNAADLVEKYLARIESLLSEARQRFGK
ncbi:MAG TPA: hypothetical protein VES64_06840 [Allosphingosinicella sp.]|nr:hypothetical protein [Allosphingosinicella sp.]